MATIMLLRCEMYPTTAAPSLSTLTPAPSPISITSPYRPTRRTNSSSFVLGRLALLGMEQQIAYVTPSFLVVRKQLQGEKWGRKRLAARHLRIGTVAGRRANLKAPGRIGSWRIRRIGSGRIESARFAGLRPARRITNRAGPDSIRFGRIGPIRPALLESAVLDLVADDSAGIQKQKSKMHWDKSDPEVGLVVLSRVHLHHPPVFKEAVILCSKQGISLASASPSYSF
ncbi:hypothetical protein Taro_034462 [Colocasia esculenta]|uniref:Uncharacterized protein n=1 Tax=Colocasia esculenta TaxID=4460 RepID=A0A843WBZ8_COLES|nr:hypothetical protein [Colocasia esculenta]